MCDEDKEFEKKVSLYYAEYDKYLMGIIKEVIPRQLASLYNHNLILGENLKQYVGSIIDVFNFRIDFNAIRKDVEEVLRSKYNLVITCDEPLTMESVK